MPHVDGVDDSVGYGVRGLSTGRFGIGVNGYSQRYYGVLAESDSYIGVAGYSSSSYGVYGSSGSYVGVRGYSDSYRAVEGYSNSGVGVYGVSSDPGSRGVVGDSIYSVGVLGQSDSSIGVWGLSKTYAGVYGASYSGYGVYCLSATGYAAYLDGRVYIRGPLTKPGGSFKIDHPLDPANKYLHHSFVESPDMKNVYDGVVVLDYKGEAVIDLPDWFAALNKDFRYQLTAIGAPGPNLYIAQEISGMTETTTNYSESSSSSNNNSSSFKIAGGTSGMKVSWQVTGIRKDPWANANRIEVEQDKPDKERGYYLHPDVYDQPEEKAISHLLFPEQEEEKWQELLINKKNKPNL